MNIVSGFVQKFSEFNAKRFIKSFPWLSISDCLSNDTKSTSKGPMVLKLPREMFPTFQAN